MNKQQLRNIIQEEIQKELKEREAIKEASFGDNTFKLVLAALLATSWVSDKISKGFDLLVKKTASALSPEAKKQIEMGEKAMKMRYHQKDRIAFYNALTMADAIQNDETVIALLKDIAAIPEPAEGTEGSNIEREKMKVKSGKIKELDTYIQSKFPKETREIQKIIGGILKNDTYLNIPAAYRGKD